MPSGGAPCFTTARELAKQNTSKFKLFSCTGSCGSPPVKTAAAFIAVVFWLAAWNGFAAAASLVNEVRVQGNLRVEEDAIRLSIQAQQGQSFDQDVVDRDVQGHLPHGLFRRRERGFLRRRNPDLYGQGTALRQAGGHSGQRQGLDGRYRGRPRYPAAHGPGREPPPGRPAAGAAGLQRGGTRQHACRLRADAGGEQPDRRHPDDHRRQDATDQEHHLRGQPGGFRTTSSRTS